MKKLIINPTKTTPAILFFVERGILNIIGKCMTEKAEEFFQEFEKSLNIFIADHSHNSLLITFELEYINTGSSKCLLNMLKKIINSLEKVTIVWGYEEDDDDILEQGKIFEESLKIPFEFRVFRLN
jgi:hypothetical protein